MSLPRKTDLPWNDEERDDMWWSIHEDQDNRGYFDEPWWLDFDDRPF